MSLNICSFPDHLWEVEEGLVFWATFLVTCGRVILGKKCLLFPKSGPWVSDALVHMDYWPFTKTRDSHSLLGQLKTDCETTFHYLQIGSKYGRFMQIYRISPTPCDKKCCSEHQTLFMRLEGLGTRLPPLRLNFRPPTDSSACVRVGSN